MALIKCPECGKEISDRTEKCPSCGYPIKKEQLKTSIKTQIVNKHFLTSKVVIAVIAIFLIGAIGFGVYKIFTPARQSIIPYGIDKSMSVNEIIQILEKSCGFTPSTVYDDSALLENGTVYNTSGFIAEVHKDPDFLLRFYYRGENTAAIASTMLKSVQSKYESPRWEGITDNSHDYVWGDSAIIILISSSPDEVYIDFQDGDVEAFLKTWLQQ